MDLSHANWTRPSWLGTVRDKVVSWFKKHDEVFLQDGVVLLIIIGTYYYTSNYTLYFAMVQLYFSYRMFVKTVKNREFTIHIDIRFPRFLTYMIMFVWFVVASDHLVNTLTGFTLFQIASDPAIRDRVFQYPFI